MKKAVFLALISTILFSLTTFAKTKQSILNLNIADYLNDYKFWFGLLTIIVSLISIILSIKSNRRSLIAEKRTQLADNAKREAATCIFLCETASGQSIEIEDRHHPEWKELSTSLHIGKTSDETYSVLYVYSNYQLNPRLSNEKTHVFTWEKWYIGINNLEKPLHIYSMFEELPKLLKRPGAIGYQIGNAVPKWISKEFSDKDMIIGITFVKETAY